MKKLKKIDWARIMLTVSVLIVILLNLFDIVNDSTTYKLNGIVLSREDSSIIILTDTGQWEYEEEEGEYYRENTIVVVTMEDNHTGSNYDDYVLRVAEQDNFNFMKSIR